MGIYFVILISGNPLTLNDEGLPIFKTDSGSVLMPHDPLPSITSNCHLRKILEAPEMTKLTKNDTSVTIDYESTSGFVLQKSETICGHELTSTSIPNVWLGPLSESSKSLPFVTPEDADLNSNMMSLSQFVTTKSTSDTNRLLNQVENQLCHRRIEAEQNAYDFSFNNPMEAGRKLRNERGWIGSAAGMHISLRKCKPVTVRPVETMAKCYNLIPVVKKRSTDVFFYDSHTSILYTTAVEIPCTDPSLPSVVIENKWFKFSPFKTPFEEPNSSMKGKPVNVTSATHEALKGFYSKNILEQIGKNKLYHDQLRDAHHYMMDLASKKLGVTGVESGFDLEFLKSAEKFIPGISSFKYVHYVLYLVLGGVAFVFGTYMLGFVAKCKQNVEKVHATPPV